MTSTPPTETDRSRGEAIPPGAELAWVCWQPPIAVPEMSWQVSQFVRAAFLAGYRAALSPIPQSEAGEREAFTIPAHHRFTGDHSDLRMRFNEAIYDGPNMNGDSGWIVHTKGHAADMEAAIERIAALSTPTAPTEGSGLAVQFAQIIAACSGEDAVIVSNPVAKAILTALQEKNGG